MFPWKCYEGGLSVIVRRSRREASTEPRTTHIALGGSMIYYTEPRALLLDAITYYPSPRLVDAAQVKRGVAVVALLC